MTPKRQKRQQQPDPADEGINLVAANMFAARIRGAMRLREGLRPDDGALNMVLPQNEVEYAAHLN